MELDRDFSEFIECCVDREVRFLIVGGYALAAHGHPRFTKDLDVWVWLDPGVVVQLGHAPEQIDLLTSVDAVGFDECGQITSSSTSVVSPCRSST
jgi:hypothetical protein